MSLDPDAGKVGFIKKRFYEFRQGHSTYLVLVLSGSNFVLLFYRLLIDYVPWLKDVFPDLYLFVLFILAVYPLSGILVGRWHINNQLPTDQQMQVNVHRFFQGLKAQLDRMEKEIKELKRIDAHA